MTTPKKPDPKPIDSLERKELHDVSGGLSVDMGAPKYSAAWWDRVRNGPGGGTAK